jgi:hypothetical protein
MRLRALVLALALSFGLTASMEAKQKPAVHRAKTKNKAWKPRKFSKSKASKQSRAAKVKPRKAPKHRV